MNKRFLVVCVAAVVLVIAVGGVSFLYGENHALNKLSVTTASAPQIASAMESDDFYGSYREKTIVVSGTVASVSTQNNDTRIELQTNSIAKAYCDIGTSSTSVKTGDAIRVLAEGFTAQRINSVDVLLTGCSVL